MDSSARSASSKNELDQTHHVATFFVWEEEQQLHVLDETNHDNSFCLYDDDAFDFGQEEDDNDDGDDDEDDDDGFSL